LLKQRSSFLLCLLAFLDFLLCLLAFLDPFVETFVETAGFSFLFAFLVPLVETYAFRMYSALGQRLLAACPKLIGYELFSGRRLAHLPLLKPLFPLARNFKLQNSFCSNSTVSMWDQQLRSSLKCHTSIQMEKNCVITHFQTKDYVYEI
jgi:hypothetical protein